MSIVTYKNDKDTTCDWLKGRRHGAAESLITTTTTTTTTFAQSYYNDS